MNLQEHYAGKNVVVTGAARGFGAALAAGFANNGACVVATDILTQQGLETAESISREGGICHFHYMDVTDEKAWSQMAEDTIERFGGFDVLINNAGVEISELFSEMDPNATRQLFDINILGTMLGIKHAFNAMKPQGTCGNGGAILNLSSVAGITSTPGVAAYSASKSAVIRLTEVAAVEAGSMGYNVRVNAVCPSLMDTQMGQKLIADFANLGIAEDTQAISEHVLSRTPLARFGVPADVVSAALFLCSDAASFLTGVSLPVDGGMSLT